MYSTCLFCQSELGANEAIEHFPVGRRLAFDAAKGRLWVVCRKCERWNLTPLEERWEAIEECEKSFRATKLRVSTDQIGLARITEGLELVRIGKPQRPEFAAWRYGDQFGKRRRNQFIQMGAIGAVAVAVPFVGPALAVATAGVGWMVPQTWNFAYYLYQKTVIVARVPDQSGDILHIRASDVHKTIMLPPGSDQGWGLRIEAPDVPWWRYARHTFQVDVHGDEAMRVAAQLLPRMNRTGASKRQLERAVALATEHTDPSVAFANAARIVATRRRRLAWLESDDSARLIHVPRDLRLALEMTSHEQSERRALEGELHLLEDAWKEAEEIAGISDNMFLPKEISDKLTEMKGD